MGLRVNQQQGPFVTEREKLQWAVCGICGKTISYGCSQSVRWNLWRNAELVWLTAKCAGRKLNAKQTTNKPKKPKKNPNKNNQLTHFIFGSQHPVRICGTFGGRGGMWGQNQGCRRRDQCLLGGRVGPVLCSLNSEWGKSALCDIT